MTNYFLDIAQLANPTRLYAEYLQGGLSDIFRYNFLDSSSASTVAGDIGNKKYNRQEIYKIILQANKRLGASEKTLANIEIFNRPDTLCVFTGQQATFCANPMYIIYKAMTAVKLAKRYSETLGKPVVPCFWMATDDHDFDEVRSSKFLRRSGEISTATYEPDVDPTGYPVADIVLDEGVSNFCGTVDKALIDTEFKQPLLDSFKEYYKPGNKLSEAFAWVINNFLGEWGLILVDPNFPGLKEHFKHIFTKEILEHDQTHDLYEQRSLSLLNNGYHAQVHKTGENLNLFYQNPKRLNLVINGGTYFPDGSSERFTPLELQEIVESTPNHFSSNVLLRPIAQCAAFPTLCHVVGPSELAYFAQIEPLFKFFDVPFPIAFPRAGMTIIEPHIRKIIYKYELDLPQLKNSLDQTVGDVVEKMFPSEAAGNVMSINECLKQDLEKYANDLIDSDPDGYRHLMNFKKHVDYELKQLQKKLKSSNKKRHDALTDQIRRVHAFLFPDCNLQERVLSPLYFVNKFGPDIFRRIYDNLEVDRPVHSILEL
ncbi:MAG: bacillithiol biosynthesis cysteine-adding enzyme BshC [candidate division Zixibacteria bacterium]|nr:bacillithiol biosynthesis cysteine-adding enzyme BshC [candidate division Zixibacteria bacterium]